MPWPGRYSVQQEAATQNQNPKPPSQPQHSLLTRRCTRQPRPDNGGRVPIYSHAGHTTACAGPGTPRHPTNRAKAATFPAAWRTATGDVCLVQSFLFFQILTKLKEKRRTYHNLGHLIGVSARLRTRLYSSRPHEVADLHMPAVRIPCL